MKPLYRRILVLAVAIVVLLGLYTIYHFFVAQQLGGAPRDFSEARSRGVALSQEIVATSNEITAAITDLGSTTISYSQASSTIGGVEDRVAIMKDKALQLATELETMTRALAEIRDEEAREAAFESISQRVELVSNLVEYADLLTMLAVQLRTNLEGGVRPGPELAELIDSINSRAEVINRLNSAANESMERFDELAR